MNRKHFIRLGSMAVMGGSFFSNSGCKKLPRTKNWAGNIEFSTEKLIRVSSIPQLQQVVRDTGNLKIQGTRHCFNRIADSGECLLSVRNMNNIISIDKEKGLVQVEGGITYGELAPILHQNGMALHNLASLPHISIAGAIATATHGSGLQNGNLATSVVALEFMDGSGDLRQLSREKDGERFAGAVVGLGALGIITKITLETVPAFDVRQYVFEGLAVKDLYANFTAIMTAGYSVSLFTEWRQDVVKKIWLKSRVDEDDLGKSGKDLFGARLSSPDLHTPASNRTPLVIPGPWFERLPHFKMGFVPSSGSELQSEYFVPIEHAVEAYKQINLLGDDIRPHLLISEIRTVAGDDLWMSPAYRQPSLTIHFTWKQETDAVMALLPRIEKALEPFKPKPHWGKLFTTDRESIESGVEKIDAFRDLVQSFDPKGRFRNEFLDTIIL
jgi:xylitol oxidase